MTIRASVPPPFVRTAVNREILAIMIKSGVFPGIGVVASLAFLRKTGSGVFRIRCRIVIRQMAGNALFG